MVGNDVRNDLLGARAAGLRTALFAGDARSLRLRRDDPRCAAVCPDLVLTHLSQLPLALRRDGPRDRGLTGAPPCAATDSLTPAGPPQRSAASRRAAAQESVGLRQTPGLSDGMGQKRRPRAAVLGR